MTDLYELAAARKLAGGSGGGGGKLPENMELSGVMNSSWWWHNAPNPGDYLWRPEDSRAAAHNRAALISGMPVRCPKGCILTASWDKAGLQISGEHVNPDGTQGDISLSWQAQPYGYDNTAGAKDLYFVFVARKPDNSNFLASELPTKLIITYSKEV